MEEGVPGEHSFPLPDLQLRRTQGRAHHAHLLYLVMKLHNNRFVHELLANIKISCLSQCMNAIYRTQLILLLSL